MFKRTLSWIYTYTHTYTHCCNRLAVLPLVAETIFPAVFFFLFDVAFTKAKNVSKQQMQIFLFGTSCSSCTVGSVFEFFLHDVTMAQAGRGGLTWRRTQYCFKGDGKYRLEY